MIDFKSVVQNIFNEVAYDCEDLDSACDHVGDRMYDRYGSAKDNGLAVSYWGEFIRPILTQYY